MYPDPDFPEDACACGVRRTSREDHERSPVPEHRVDDGQQLVGCSEHIVGVLTTKCCRISDIAFFHSFLSSDDQRYVSILLDCLFKLSSALHGGIRFLPHPVPYHLPFPHRMGSLPRSGREVVGVSKFDLEDSCGGLGTISNPEGVCLSVVSKGQRYDRPRTVLVQASIPEGTHLRFRLLGHNGFSNDSHMFAMPPYPRGFGMAKSMPCPIVTWAPHPVVTKDACHARVMSDR